MTKEDRPTLKSFFRSGALPTEEEFSALIDSTVNIMDDGFSKTDADGMQLASKGGSLRIMSMYQGLGATKPSWVFDHGAKVDGALHIRPDEGKDALAGPKDGDTSANGDAPLLSPPNLTLTRDGRMGVNRSAPDWRLDVGGIARMEGRTGTTTHQIPAVRANGIWQDITHELTGCHALEIMAGAAGPEGEGRYSLLHAIALNTFQPRNPILNWFFKRRSIKTQTAMYGRYADRLRLKWIDAKDNPLHYKLQICTNADFGKHQYIRYTITRLWFDTKMLGCTSTSADDPIFKTDRDPDLL